MGLTIENLVLTARELIKALVNTLNARERFFWKEAYLKEG